MDTNNIFSAIKEKNIDKVKKLISDGINIDMKGESGFAPLMQAVFENNREILLLLIENNASLNDKTTDERFEGLSALAFAALYGYKEMSQILLENGADINSTDGLDFTPLMHAAENGHLEVVKLLFDYKPDINARNWQGKTALMLATMKVWKQIGSKIIQLLLENGADPNIMDNISGDTALILASIDGDIEIAQLLLNKGANINLKDLSGKTALDYALQNEHEEIKKLLNDLQDNG